MADRTSHAPGTFCWTDLATSDVASARYFYGALFGWTFEDLPASNAMAFLGGRAVAALVGQTMHPPHWNSYVSVEDADATAARVAELGGTVLEQPFDVGDSARIAPIVDPTGAAFAIWQPLAHAGAGVVNEPGALTWNDLVTPDVDAAARFYEALFGWAVEEIPDSGGYRTIANGGRLNGGMQPPRAEGMPAMWYPYFGHADIEQALAAVGDGGGQVHAGPIAMPSGRIAVCTDPQGAVFAIWSGAYED